MSAPIAVCVEGVGVWAAGLPGWPAAQAALCAHERVWQADAVTRPAPSLLPPTERRRAPESVLLAIEVAQQACAMAGRDPRELPHVFASAYGDLAISDYLCATLVRSPLEMSPTKFHNSVHNAPAGYWTIATGCRENSTAVSAGVATFGAALLEAALLAATDSSAVLLVVYDIAAVGLLTDLIDCNSAFAAALVLAPPSASTGALGTLHLCTVESSPLAPDASLLHPTFRSNPAAQCLPLLRALAQRQHTTIPVAAGPDLQLAVETLF